MGKKAEIHQTIEKSDDFILKSLIKLFLIIKCVILNMISNSMNLQPAACFTVHFYCDRGRLESSVAHAE